VPQPSKALLDEADNFLNVFEGVVLAVLPDLFGVDLHPHAAGGLLRNFDLDLHLEGVLDSLLQLVGHGGVPSLASVLDEH
jgi:hypothetical protein